MQKILYRLLEIRIVTSSGKQKSAYRLLTLYWELFLESPYKDFLNVQMRRYCHISFPIRDGEANMAINL